MKKELYPLSTLHVRAVQEGLTEWSYSEVQRNLKPLMKPSGIMVRRSLYTLDDLKKALSLFYKENPQTN